MFVFGCLWESPPESGESMGGELRKTISQVAAISPGTQRPTSTLVSAAMADRSGNKSGKSRWSLNNSISSPPSLNTQGSSRSGNSRLSH